MIVVWHLGCASGWLVVCGSSIRESEKGSICREVIDRWGKVFCFVLLCFVFLFYFIFFLCFVLE